LISTLGLNKTASKILGMLDHARYTLDGVTTDAPIYDSTIEGHVVTVFVLFDNRFSGNFTKFELIDVDGDVYATQVDSIQKVNTKLLLVTFKFSIVEDAELVPLPVNPQV
jgi:hypothetical protein